MSTPKSAVPPVQVQLRLTTERTLLIRSHPPQGSPKIVAGKKTPAPIPSAPSQNPPGQPIPIESSLGYKPVVVLIEATTTGAEALTSAVTDVLESMGSTCGVISLDRQNRTGARFGCPLPAPGWCWKQTSADILIQQGHRLIVPAPAVEDELTPDDVDRLLQKVSDSTDGMVIDLGCRWVPRLFRPVLARATHIWVVVRNGQWGAAEIRLDQAEFSGWTDTDRIRLVVIGQGGALPSHLGVEIAAVLYSPEGPAAKEFVVSELRRMV